MKMIPTIPDYFFITSLENGLSVSINAIGTPPAISLQYSNDGTNWNQYTIGNIITVNNGEKLYFKGNNSAFGSDIDNYNKFNITGRCDLCGNIMSLLYGDNFNNQTSLTQNYCFVNLFYQCGIIDANFLELPATTLSENCYRSMFIGCTSLTTAPTLPATRLKQYCYRSMFYGCTSLTTAPTLPATSLAEYCYTTMFYGCSSLVNVPSTLPATTLAYNCYQNMFRDCTSLTTAPTLPATSLAENCYDNMFRNCTSLTTAPTLPATTLKQYCYRSMFYDCTSLTTAPVLNAKTLVAACYNYMFRYCSSLKYIKAMFTTSPSTKYLNSWVEGVASSGTYVKNKSASYTTRGISAIPSGWTLKTATS